MFEHATAPRFWQAFHALPKDLQELAKKQFSLLEADPQHPSLQFKKIRDTNGVQLWSARVTQGYRALAVKRPTDFLWFWIGDHKTYEGLIR